MNKVTKMGVGAVGLLLFFAACEKEIPANIGEGKKVSILFSIEPTGYNTVDEMVRSADALEPVTSTIPLNDDLFLQATLVPDAEEELRAPIELADGQKIRFVAYDISDSSSPVDSKLYTYSTYTKKFTPDGEPLGVEPDGTTVYRFVAYSYFGETGVAPAAAAIDPVHDLVWGKAATDRTVVDTEVSRTVSINMLHKFARVRVQVRTNISGATISVCNGVQIEGGQQATLDSFTGDVSWSGSVTQNMGITVPSSPASNDIYGDYRTVKPVASPTKVRIGSVRVSTNSTTFSNNVLDFSTPLNGGTSYTLLVVVKRASLWAGSNIMWDGSKLVFLSDENSGVGAVHSQGLFFKWGSLVAIKPIGTYGASQYDSMYNTGSIIFSPTGTYSYAWGSIPYMDTTSSPFNNSTATEDDFASYNGTGFNAAEGKGDICRYITSQGWVKGRWRLPKASDYTALMTEAESIAFASGWSVSTFGESPSTSYGQATINGSWVRIRHSGLSYFFTYAASGYRSGSGTFSGLNTNGYFWSGSSDGTSNCSVLHLAQNVLEVVGLDRSLGFPVRCRRAN
jgi:hypothetical protein